MGEIAALKEAISKRLAGVEVSNETATLRAYAVDGLLPRLVVEHCPVDLKRLISVWGETGVDFYLMQRLKNQFDPGGTFVKGRFVGGL
jgi:glycolate dehydrogenase FAD-binding subunit